MNRISHQHVDAARDTNDRRCNFSYPPVSDPEALFQQRDKDTPKIARSPKDCEASKRSSRRMILVEWIKRRRVFVDRQKRSRASALVIAALSIVLIEPAQTQDYERDLYVPNHVEMSQDGSFINEVQNRGLLKVGLGLFEPWVMCDVDGDLIGYEVDVAREMAGDWGVRIQFVRTDWYFIIPALIEEEFDIIVSGMGITPERSLRVNFSIPYSEFGSTIVANTTQTEGLIVLMDFNSANVVFGVRAGTVLEHAVRDQFPKAMLQLFDTDTELLQALLDGEIHAAAVDQVKAARWLDHHSSILHRPFEELFNKIPEAVAMRKGDVDGLNVVNSWIEHHRTTGWLSDRRRQWFDSRDWADQVASDPDVIRGCEESFEPNPF